MSGYKVDVAFPKQKVAIETDGWAFHSDHDAFQHDREPAAVRSQNNLVG